MSGYFEEIESLERGEEGYPSSPEDYSEFESNIEEVTEAESEVEEVESEVEEVESRKSSSSYNITTSDIIDEVESMKEKSEKESDRMDEISKEIREKEEKLIESKQICNSEVLKEISLKYHSINQKSIQKRSVDELENFNSLKAIACMIESRTYFHGGISNILKIKKLYHNLQRFGAESANGTAYRASFDEMDNIFVLKTSKDSLSKEDDLLHEMVVGVFGTNRLREYIPNFSYVYGGFRCGPPITEEDGKVLSFCSQNHKVNYIIYENIQDAISVKDYIVQNSKEKVLSMFLQIVFCLNTAKEMIDFTHFDLHDNNVLMRRYSKSELFQIKYSFEGKEYFLLTDRIATIIDYGMSHIEYEGEYYGYTGLTKYSIYPLLSHVFHDIYKFLMFCSELAYDENAKESFQAMTQLFYFFNKEEKLEDVIEKNEQRNKYYSLPYYQDLKISDFVDYIFKTFDVRSVISETKRKEYPLLSCDEGCMDVESILQSSYFKDESFISIVDYYDLSISKNIDLSDFDYEKAKEKMIEESEIENTNILSKLKNIENIKEEKTFLYEFLKILDLYTILLYENKILQSVSQTFGDKVKIVDRRIIDEIDKYYQKMKKLPQSKQKKKESEKKLISDMKERIEEYYKDFRNY